MFVVTSRCETKCDTYARVFGSIGRPPTNDYVEATQFMIDVCDENIIAMYHITADDRVMGSVSGAKKLLRTVQNSKYTTRDEEEINRIYVSLLCPNSDKVIDPDSYVAQLVEASGGIIYTAAEEEEMEIQPVLFAAAAQTNARPPISSYRPPTRIQIVKENLVNILGEGNGREYKVLGSSGLVTITLDKALKKNALTDTDYDGLTDWNEVNADLIYRICVQCQNKDISSITKIKTSDLPTLADWKYYYKGSTDSAKDYVEQGYYQLLGKYVLPNCTNWQAAIDQLDSTRILPFYSNPVDADSDNDGIPDYCDLNKLRKGSILNDLDESCGTKNIDTFTVIKDFSIPQVVHQTPYNQINAYPLPKASNTTIFTYNYNSGAKIYVYGIIKTTDDYWIRIRHKGNGKMGYIRCDVIDFDVSKYFSRLDNISDDLFYCQTAGWWDDIDGNDGSSRCILAAVASASSINSGYKVLPYNVSTDCTAVTINGTSISRAIKDETDGTTEIKALDEYKQNNSIPSFVLYKFLSMEDALYAINSELNNNRSVVVKTTYHGEHWVTVTGTIDGTPALCFEDFVGIDPWYNGNNEKGFYNYDTNFAGVFKLNTNANQTFYRPYTIMTISFD